MFRNRIVQIGRCGLALLTLRETPFTSVCPCAAAAALCKIQHLHSELHFCWQEERLNEFTDKRL